MNPNSGQGKAQQIWKYAQEIFAQVNFEYDVIVTKRRYQAQDDIANLPLKEIKKYEGILIISGDGLIHEVVNGIFSRKDAKEVSSLINIGHIAGGTGNALVRNILGLNDQKWLCLQNQIFFIAKGNTRQFDLIEISNESNEKYYSFMSLTYGFISDVDLESEFLRILGQFRNYIYSVYRLINLRRYPIKLSVCKDVQMNVKIMPDIQQDLSQDKQWETIKDSFYFMGFNIQKWIDSELKMTPFYDYDQGLIEIYQMRASTSRFKLLKMLLELDDQASHVNHKKLTPKANSGLEFIKVRAFRMEPYNFNMGAYDVDGERYDIQKIQGCIIDKALHVYCN